MFSPCEGDTPPCPVFIRSRRPFTSPDLPEVALDASGRIIQASDRWKTVHATTRDTSGRIVGTATTHPNAGGSAQTNTATPRPAPTTVGASRHLTGSITTHGGCQSIALAPVLAGMNARRTTILYQFGIGQKPQL